MVKTSLCFKSVIILTLVTVFVASETKAASDLWLYQVDTRNQQVDRLFHPGESISIRCRIWNVGEDASDDYTADFYIGSYLLGSVERSSVGSDEYDIFTETWEFTDDIPEGYYRANVTITSANDNDSQGGSNSTQDSWGGFRFARKVPPDISIYAVDAVEGIYQPGESISVDFCVDAIGGQLTIDCEINVYASVDLDISVDDYKIQSVGISGLEPGTSSCFDVICHFPTDIPLGKYYIGIIATCPTSTGTETKVGQDSQAIYMGEPADLAAQSIDVPGGAYSPGNEINVHSLIENIGKQTSDNYSVYYYASTDNTIATTDYEIGYVSRTGLAAGEQHSYDTICRLPENLYVGNYYIGMIVTCSNDGNAGNDVKYDSGTIRIVLPTDVIAGRMMYQDRDGGEHPIRYALVRIFDGNDDQMLKETYTDGNGNYSVRVPSHGLTAQDIYVKVCTEGVSGAYADAMSKICSVRDEVFEEIYCLQSDLYPNPEDSSLTVNMAAPNSGGEFMVFDSIVEGFHKAKVFFGVTLKEVEAFWPNSRGYSYYDPGKVEIHISQDDRGDRDVIIHEYAHYVTQTYDFAKGDVGDNAVHYWNADLRNHPSNRSYEQARNLAFREAWASLYSIAVQYGDTWYPYSGDAIYQDLDEESGWLLKADLERDDDDNNSPGQYYENMNACALWDIFDDREDGYLDLLSDPGLEKIWVVSRYYKPDDILQFWDGWCENYGFERKIKYIFRAHQLPYNDPGFTLPPNRPPIANAGEDQVVLQTCELGIWFTLDGGGSYDPDGDEIEYYHWSAADVTKTGKAGMTLVLPVGQTTAHLTVDDGELQGSDSVVITVIPTDPDEWTELCW